VLNKTGIKWDELKKEYYKKKSWYNYHLHKTKKYLRKDSSSLN
jgi:hypothetical protein